jgi:hypothetical protein
MIQLVVGDFEIGRIRSVFVGVSGCRRTQKYLVIAVSKKKIEYSYPLYKTKLLAFISFIQETY